MDRNNNGSDHDARQSHGGNRRKLAPDAERPGEDQTQSAKRFGDTDKAQEKGMALV